MKLGLLTLIGAAMCGLLLPANSGFAQGSLTPPGPPAPTMKTLEQIEPRTPISNLPFTIVVPGSYYVVTNLTGVSGQNGITIAASGVTLDLMGFELAGVTGALAGVGVTTPVHDLSVRNGTLRGWGAGGLDAFQAEGVRLERLQAVDNTGVGLGVGNAALIHDCLVRSNTTYGIANSGMGVVRDCAATGNVGGGISSVGPVRACSAHNNQGRGISSSTSVIDSDAEYNGGTGIAVETGGHVRSCTAKMNSGVGVSADLGSEVIDCTVYNNESTGIVATARSAVLNCTLLLNGGPGVAVGIGSTVRGCTVRQSGGDGIVVPNDCSVSENHCTLNNGAGIHVTSAGNRVEANSLILNQEGIWLPPNSANLVIRNSARYNPGSGAIGSSNYVGIAGNDVGPIGSASSSTSPWANISY